MHTRILASIACALLLSLVACQTPPRADSPTSSAPAASQPDPMLSVNTLLPAPPGFAEMHIGRGKYVIPAYAKFLKGVRIVLDPGHGGDSHQRGFKRGPSGVREAEMNLRVARYLRVLLTQVGADVRLTRDGDYDQTHQQRADFANDWPADLFLSIHHNAIDNKPNVNYTTVWQHGDVDHRPANLDLARYINDGLHDALNFPQHATVPIKSDQLMYPDGFAVLRYARVTACLAECSFFTNPAEEQRLREPHHNLDEAHGLFLGLAKYAAAGLPRVKLIEPPDSRLAIRETGDARLVFELDDGLRSRRAWGHERQMIVTDSLAVRVDGARVEHEFSNDGYRLIVRLPADLKSGKHTVRVHFSNMFKNAPLNPDFEIEVTRTEPQRTAAPPE